MEERSCQINGFKFEKEKEGTDHITSPENSIKLLFNCFGYINYGLCNLMLEIKVREGLTENGILIYTFVQR